MKKHYILNLKSYLLITLYIISFIAIIGEQTQAIDFKTFLVIKIIGIIYFVLFTYTNFIRKQNI